MANETLDPIKTLGNAMSHCMGVWYRDEHGVTDSQPFGDAASILQGLHDEFCAVKYAPARGSNV